MSRPVAVARRFFSPNEEIFIMKLETIAVHGGQSPDPTTKSVAVPI